VTTPPGRIVEADKAHRDAPARDGYTLVTPITTRWMDDDVYRHANNVVYYSWFDTAVNGYLIAATGCDIRQLPAVGIVAETSCRYFREVAFPDRIQPGLACERLGRSSVVYHVALFRNDEDRACALGRFVHVYVDAQDRRPVPVPDIIRAAVERLAAVSSG